MSERIDQHLPVHHRKRTTILISLFIVFGIVGALMFRGCDPAPTQVSIVAGGNIACGLNDPDYNHGQGRNGQCAQLRTSDVALALQPNYVFGLGNYQFELPTTQAYDTAYGDSWGRLRSITVPALGNQEYKVHAANTFRKFFDGRVPADQSYWSFNTADWHIVVLDSNCTTLFGGCLNSSPEQTWLEHDLATNTSKCVMAIWHHARWSNGIAGRDERTRDLYKTLYRFGVDVLLSSHDFDYERFGPLNPIGQPDPKGVVQFVAGNAGQAHYVPTVGNAPWRKHVAPIKSQFSDFTHFGVLNLTLSAGKYSWKYYQLDSSAKGPHVAGATMVDSGHAQCR